MSKKYFVFSLVFSALLLCSSGCGFTLRQLPPLPTSLNPLYLSEEKGMNRFTRILKRQLKQRDIHLVDKPDERLATLTILAHRFTTQTLTYAPDGSAARNRLTLTVRYQITFPTPQDKPIEIITKSVQSSRDFSVATNQLLSDQTERAILEETLRQSAVQHLLRQLAYLS